MNVKHPLDWSDKTFEKWLTDGDIHWSPLHFMAIQQATTARLNDSVRWTWVLLQQFLWNDKQHLGCLSEDGKPITIATAARRLGKSDVKLQAHVNILMEVGLLKSDGEVIYDPWLVKHLSARKSRKVKTQTSANAEVSISTENGDFPRGNGVDSSSKNALSNFVVVKVEGEVERSDTTSTSTSRTTGTQHFSPSAGAGEKASSTTEDKTEETTTVPSGCSADATHPSEQQDNCWLSEFRTNPAYANINIDAELRKWQVWSEEKGYPLTPANFGKWMDQAARYRAAKRSAPKKPRTKAKAEAKPVE